LFALNYTVMRSNLQEVGQAVALWDEAGFDQIGFMPMVVRHPDMEAESIYPIRELYYANMDAAAEELILKRRRINTSTSAVPISSRARCGSLIGRIFTGLLLNQVTAKLARSQSCAPHISSVQDQE
jgi:hypothetical protein